MVNVIVEVRQKYNLTPLVCVSAIWIFIIAVTRFLWKSRNLVRCIFAVIWMWNECPTKILFPVTCFYEHHNMQRQQTLPRIAKDFLSETLTLLLLRLLHLFGVSFLSLNNNLDLFSLKQLLIVWENSLICPWICILV